MTFEDCLLRQSDAMGAELDGVRFQRCDMTEFDLRDATLTGCEIDGCRLEGLLGADRLRGTTMPWADIVGNAGLWAGELGIRVRDEDA